VLVQGHLHVDVTKLLYHDRLPEKLRVGLRAAFIVASGSFRKLVCVDVLEAGDIVDLSQFFGRLVKRLEYFVQMLHVLENEGFSLVENQVLNI